jgi:hypothetical protein
VFFSFLDLPRRWWAKTTAEVTARKFVGQAAKTFLAQGRRRWASISANWDARSKLNLKILGGNRDDMDNITQLLFPSNPSASVIVE